MKAKDYFYRIGQSDASRRRKASFYKVLYGGTDWPIFAVQAYQSGYIHQRFSEKDRSAKTARTES